MCTYVCFYSYCARSLCGVTVHGHNTQTFFLTTQHVFLHTPDYVCGLFSVFFLFFGLFLCFQEHKSSSRCWNSSTVQFWWFVMLRLCLGTSWHTWTFCCMLTQFDISLSKYNLMMEKQRDGLESYFLGLTARVMRSQKTSGFHLGRKKVPGLVYLSGSSPDFLCLLC